VFGYRQRYGHPPLEVPKVSKPATGLLAAYVLEIAQRPGERWQLTAPLMRERIEPHLIGRPSYDDRLDELVEADLVVPNLDGVLHVTGLGYTHLAAAALANRRKAAVRVAAGGAAGVLGGLTFVAADKLEEIATAAGLPPGASMILEAAPFLISVVAGVQGRQSARHTFDHLTMNGAASRSASDPQFLWREQGVIQQRELDLFMKHFSPFERRVLAELHRLHSHPRNGPKPIAFGEVVERMKPFDVEHPVPAGSKPQILTTRVNVDDDGTRTEIVITTHSPLESRVHFALHALQAAGMVNRGPMAHDDPLLVAMEKPASGDGPFRDEAHLGFRVDPSGRGFAVAALAMTNGRVPEAEPLPTFGLD
jgi:hypothetical protein